MEILLPCVHLASYLLHIVLASIFACVPINRHAALVVVTCCGTMVFHRRCIASLIVRNVSFLSIMCQFDIMIHQRHHDHNGNYIIKFPTEPMVIKTILPLHTLHHNVIHTHSNTR